MNPRVKNIKSDVLSDDWYLLNKINFDYQLENGNWVNQSRESYDRGNGATILLYNKEKYTVLLIKQFRMPTYVNGNDSGIIIETCGGLLDGDDPLKCILKETEEDVGYKILKAEKVFQCYMSPGAVTEILHFFIAEYNDEMKVGDGGGLASEHEEIEILELDFKIAQEMITRGKIVDAKTIMLLQYAQINNIFN